MSEITRILQISSKTAAKSWQSTENWHRFVSSHLKSLDECLEELFNELQPSNYIITSDHSIVPWTHNIDFNGFLAEYRLVDLVTSPMSSTKNILKFICKPKARQIIFDTPVGKSLQSFFCSGGNVSAKSRAFSGKYVYGIYVNDTDRFGGPVHPGQAKEIVDEIIDLFNWRSLSEGIKMKAVPYREKFQQTPFYDSLPDVYIEQDGHAFPSTLGPNWYSRNPNFSPVTTLKGCGGMHSGQKGTKPILMVNPSLDDLKQEQDNMDLRLVYQLTQRLFSSL